MNKEQRQNHIMRLIEESNGQQLGTRELAEQFGVSEMTVRRDLQELSDDGLLRRQHGGASPMHLPGRAAFPRVEQEDHRRKQIGVILASTTGMYTDPFFNAVLEGAHRKLQELGYRIAYINTGAEVSTATQARTLLESNPVEGVILVGPPLGEEGLEYLRSNVSVLIQTTESIGSDLDTVTFDGYFGMQQMVDHLVKNRRDRLGYITGLYELRYKGFLDAVQARGLDADSKLHLLLPFGVDGWTPDLGVTGAQKLMQLANPPDAIVCASDRIAIGAIQWLHQHNIRVPEDIAVTGFDNIAESAFTSPSLTTVHVYKQLMGELAAERAVKRIENENEIPLLIQTPTHLVIRRSCGSE